MMGRRGDDDEDDRDDVRGKSLRSVPAQIFT